MWEYGDLHHSSQGEALCVACDIITHFLSGTGYLCRFKLLQREERSEPGSPRSSVSALTFQPLGEDGEGEPPSPAVFSVGTNLIGVSKINFTNETGKGLVFCGSWQTPAGRLALREVSNVVSI